MSAYQSLGNTAWKETEGRMQRGDEVTFYVPTDEDRRPEFRIILVGKTGGGKSATGNSILRKQKFESEVRSTPVTVTCQKEQSSCNGKNLLIIDTSAIFDQNVWDSVTCREIIRCIKLSAPGPHALVLVTQLGRYTDEDKKAVKRVQDIFGVDAMRHTVVLFTRKEDLRNGSLSDYVRNNKDLRRLVQRCGNRYCAFNNKATGAEQADQVSELVAMIQGMVQKNRGSYYVNGMYLDSNLTEERVRAHIRMNRIKALFIQYKEAFFCFGVVAFLVLAVPLLISFSH